MQTLNVGRHTIYDLFSALDKLLDPSGWPDPSYQDRALKDVHSAMRITAKEIYPQDMGRRLWNKYGREGHDD